MLITHLDDVEMHDSYVYRHWDNYLLSSSSTQGRNYDSLGFCIDETLYALRPEDCCEANYSSRSTEHAIHGSRQVCYQTSGQDLTDNRRKKEGGGDTSIGHCFDPGELLGHPRCTDTCHEENQTCIYPASSANLLRITARNTFNGVEEVILYRGQKNQLWNDIKIGRYLASHKSIQSLPLDIETFWL